VWLAPKLVSIGVYWCILIAVDHTYNRIPGLLGSHELLCTVFRANLTRALEISGFY